MKNKKEELTLVQLSSHLRINEGLKAQENNMVKGKDIAGPSNVNMVKKHKATKQNDMKKTNLKKFELMIKIIRIIDILRYL